MALHILNQAQPGVGYQLGRGLGTGLQALAENKIRHYEQRKSIDTLKSLGLPEEEATFFSENPQLLQPFLERGGISALQQEQPEQQPNEQQIQQANEAFQNDPEFRSFAEKQPEFQSIMQALQQGGPSGLGMMKSLAGAQLQQPQQQRQISPSAIPVSQPQKSPSLVTQPQQVAPQVPRRKSALEVLGQPSPREQKLEEYRGKKLGLEEERLNRAEQAKVDKETKPYYDQITKEARGAKENDKRLNQMEQLIESKRLSNPAYVSALKTLSKGILGIGINLEHLAGPETEQFEKLSSDFLRNARDIFGSRLTNYDVESFLKTIPTTTQSNAAKQALINNLRTFNEASRLRKVAMDKIIKENGGKRPANLDSLVEEQISPLLDQFADVFKQNIREVPQAEPFGISILKGAARLFV